MDKNKNTSGLNGFLDSIRRFGKKLDKNAQNNENPRSAEEVYEDTLAENNSISDDMPCMGMDDDYDM